MDIYTQMFLIFCGVIVGVMALGSIIEVLNEQRKERVNRRRYIRSIGAMHDVTRYVR